MWHVPKSQHALRTESFLEELIIKTWSGMEMAGWFQNILKQDARFLVALSGCIKIAKPLLLAISIC